VFRNRTIGRVLAAALVLAPPAILAALIHKYSVNVPYWDEWEADFAGIFEKYAAAHLTLQDLFAQHNEARLFFPRILFLVLGNLTRGDVRYMMAATFVIVCLTSFMIYRLAAPGYRGRPVARFAVIFLSSLLLFSPVNHEAWLWGSDVARYLPLACITGGLLMARLRTSWPIKLLGGAVLSIVSTFSFSSGFLCWIALTPALFCFGRPKGASHTKLGLVLWLAGFALCEALYFLGYQHPPDYRPMYDLWLSSLEHPSRSAQYFFCFLGAPLAATASNPLSSAALLGGISVALFAAACLGVFALKDKRDLIAETEPWMVIGACAILNALLATTSRSAQFGVEQALSPRYGVYGLTLLVGIIHLVPLLVFKALQTSGASRAAERMAYGGLVGLAGGLCAVHLWAFPAYVYGMRCERGDRLLAKSCLAFINVLPQQPAVADVLYPNYERLKPMVASLARQGLLNPPPFTHYPTNLLRQTPPGPDKILGYLERCERVGTNDLVLAGWALSASQPREADAVLLSYEQEDGEPRLFGLARARVLRADLALLYGEDPYYYSGWERICTMRDLPKGVLVLRAWSYDSQRQAALPLGGTASLDTR
jgi:hypothetical protein